MNIGALLIAMIVSLSAIGIDNRLDRIAAAIEAQQKCQGKQP